MIIDEAHERSLATEIVLGVAKLTLAASRRGERAPFYVVIASATIDPRPFLAFFGCTHPGKPRWRVRTWYPPEH